MAKKTKDQIRFEIDQLRKDKIIYQVESSAMSLVALVIYFFVPVASREMLVLPSNQELVQKWFAVILAITVLYWLYTAFGNILRLKKIKKLESQL